MSGKEEGYTCVCCLLIILVVGLYVVWTIYGSLPFVIGGLAIGGIGFLIFWNSRKVKETQQQAESIRTARTLDQRLNEERYEREQQAIGLEKYVNRKGEAVWGTPEQVAEWARLDKASVEVVYTKEVVKIRCPYCGKLYDEPLSSCPNCNASR